MEAEAPNLIGTCAIAKPQCKAQVHAMTATRHAWRFVGFKAGLLEDLRLIDRRGARLLHCHNVKTCAIVMSNNALKLPKQDCAFSAIPYAKRELQSTRNYIRHRGAASSITSKS